MELKEGYKITEMGVIPIDWEVRKFEDVMAGFSSGQTPYREIKRYYSGSIPWITSGELDYNIITDTAEKITLEAVRRTNLKIIPAGTFLFAITGLEAAGTRGSCAITGIPATTNQSCMALYPIKNKLISKYLFHYYVRYGNELAFKYCQGTKQQSFTGGIAKTLPIILPPTIEEQTAIADALSDADALIGNLKKLIAKKRNIKQGVMHELLTGKRRLPKFTKEWIFKKIGDVTTVVAGGTPSTAIKDYWGGNIRWMSSGELNMKRVFEVYGRITDYGLNNSSTRMIPKKCVLMGLAGQGKTRGTVAINEVELCTNQSIAAILPANTFITEYLFYNLDNRYEELRMLSSGDGGRGGLNLTLIKNLQVPFPEREEQYAIATVLCDIDKEITSLETKLGKYKMVKQGILQNLLTGKIRLIKKEEDHAMHA